MTVRVGINGFGRIGRNFFRAARAAGADIEIVAVNDLTDNKTLAHLLKYDSILGRLDADVSSDESSIKVGDQTIAAFAERDPANLKWGDIAAHVVYDSTGIINHATNANPHIPGRAPAGLGSWAGRLCARRRGRDAGPCGCCPAGSGRPCTRGPSSSGPC